MKTEQLSKRTFASQTVPKVATPKLEFARTDVSLTMKLVMENVQKIFGIVTGAVSSSQTFVKNRDVTRTGK